MRGGVLIVLALAAAPALGSCGGPEDPGQYGSRLDAACVELFDAVNSLPARVQSGELEVGEVQGIAERSEQGFVAAVEDLDPPEELAGRQEDLLAALERGDDGNDLEAAKRTLAELAEIYADLGAGECERRSAESVVRFEAVPRPSP